jgi:histidinol phosphatase-like PHP family hydrolase
MKLPTKATHFDVKRASIHHHQRASVGHLIRHRAHLTYPVNTEAIAQLNATHHQVSAAHNRLYAVFAINYPERKDKDKTNLWSAVYLSLFSV